MEMKNNIIGEVSVKVEAALSVDERTFQTCMNLISIYAKNKGLPGGVINFHPYDPSIHWCKSDEECDAAIHAIYDTRHGGKKESNNE